MQNRFPRRGFTLLELMVVITIIMVLVGIAIPRFQQAVRRSREAALKENLMTLRTVIDQYTLDKLRAPQSLDDLVSAGYLRRLPNDITDKNTTWRVEYEDVLLSPDQSESGIVDVHSGSDAISLEGTPYSSW